MSGTATLTKIFDSLDIPERVYVVEFPDRKYGCRVFLDKGYCALVAATSYDAALKLLVCFTHISGGKEVPVGIDEALDIAKAKDVDCVAYFDGERYTGETFVQ